jgi:hypothetical protein
LGLTTEEYLRTTQAEEEALIEAWGEKQKRRMADRCEWYAEFRNSFRKKESDKIWTVADIMPHPKIKYANEDERIRHIFRLFQETF